MKVPCEETEWLGCHRAGAGRPDWAKDATRKHSHTTLSGLEVLLKGSVSSNVLLMVFVSTGNVELLQGILRAHKSLRSQAFRGLTS